MVQHTQSQSHVPEIIDRLELGRRLGISQQKILKLDRAGKLKSFRVGGAVRYVWAEVFAELQKTPGYRGR